MLELMTQSSWTDRIGWVLVHSLWQFALLALLASVLQLALRRRSATTRYWALLAAMFIMVAVPVVTWFSPWSANAPVVAAKFGPIEKPANVSPSQRGDGTVSMTTLPTESPVELATKPHDVSQRLQPVPIGIAASLSLVQRRVQPWLPEIVLAWLVGVLVAAFRPLLSWYAVRRLRTLGVLPVDGAVHGLLQRTAKSLRLNQAIDVLQSTLVKTPVVVGYFRPVVLLPLCVVTGLPAAQLELILAHELAHIRRHDYLVNLLQILVETLFFYHPAVWWLSRQIRTERENCCDDVAMATVGTRVNYGRALLAVEELRATSTILSLAAHGGSLLARIRRIAGCEPPSRIAGGGSILGVILVAIAIFAAVTWGAAPAVEKPEQAPAETENRMEQTTAETVVAGQVVDSAGKAIAGAQVAVVGRLRNPSTDSLLTDELRLLGFTKAGGEGRFRLNIPKLSSAAYFNATKVVAVADGFNLGWQPIGEDVENPRVTVSLTAEQTIHGRVLDANGKPADNAKVLVTCIGKSLPGDFDGIQCWTLPSQLPFWPKPVTTDREGRFTLRGVDRSQILNVQVRDDRFSIDWIHLGIYLGFGDKDAHVTVSPSGEVTLSPPPARMFEGKITYDDTHQPVAKARVEIGGSFGPNCIMNMAGRTDAEGRFRLNPYSGNVFYISVYPPDGEPYLSYQKEIKLSGGQQPPQIEIALPRGVLLRGQITEKSSGESVVGALVKYEEQSRPPYRPDRILPDHSAPHVRGASRADGTYQIAVPPGCGTLFVQGPRNDYIRQTINTWDFNSDRNWTIAIRHYVSAYASLDVKPNQAPAESNLAIRRGVTVRGRIVGPENRPVGDVLILSRHFLGVNEDTWNGGNIRVKSGQFELHGLDPEASVPVYFLDPKNETGATVRISGKSADNGPLVVHLQPCGKAVARFVTPQGKPKVKYNPGLQILVSPGPFREDRKRSKKEISSDQGFVANFDREHYWNKPFTDEEGRCTFPSLIPGATYRIDLMNKLGDWDERDFTVKSGETLQLPDITIPEPPKLTADAAADAKDKLPTADQQTGVRSSAAREMIVHGTVLSPDGQPVPNATVRAATPLWAMLEPIVEKGAKPPTSEVKADSRGQFTISFTTQPFGDLGRLDRQWRDIWKETQIAALAPGYGPAWVAYKDIKPDRPLTLRLVPDVPILGRVVDLDGRPIADLTIEVGDPWAAKDEDLTPWLSAIKAGELPWTVVRLAHKQIAPSLVGIPSHVTTDQQGRFEIGGVGRERHLDLKFQSETVAHRSIGVATRKMEPINRVIIDRPFEGTEPVDGAEFTVTAAPSHPIVGTVRDAKTGQPLKGISVESYMLAGYPYANHRVLKTTTDEQGRFRLLGMPIGKGNKILAVPNDDQPYFMREVNLPNPAGLGPATADITLHRGIWITGRVTDKVTGEPVSARLHYLPFRSNQFVQSIPEFSKGGHVDGDQTRYNTRADGSYRLVGLPGRAIIGTESVLRQYRRGLGSDEIKGLDRRGQFDTYLNPIEPGRNWPTAMKEINPPAGAESVTVDFALDPGQPVHIATVDPDGQPISGVTVDGATSGGYKETINEATFEATNFKPGETRTVVFFHKGRGLGCVTRISVNQNDAQPIAVKLQPAGKVKGRLLYPDGKPVTGAEVEAWVLPSEHSGKRLPSATADAQGRFECVLLPGTSYSLMARGADIARFGSVGKDVSVEPGQIKDLGDVKIGREQSKQ